MIKQIHVQQSVLNSDAKIKVFLIMIMMYMIYFIYIIITQPITVCLLAVWFFPLTVLMHRYRRGHGYDSCTEAWIFFRLVFYYWCQSSVHILQWSHKSSFFNQQFKYMISYIFILSCDTVNTLLTSILHDRLCTAYYTLLILNELILCDPVLNSHDHSVL